jgi:putative hydrolase of the HAD superfamily
LGVESAEEVQSIIDEFAPFNHSFLHLLLSAQEAGRLPRGAIVDTAEFSHWFGTQIDFESALTEAPARFRDMLRSCPLKLVAFTNSPRMYAWRVLGALGLREFFEHSFYALEDVLPHAKPELEAFREVLALSGSLASESVMIENSMKNVRAAKQVGMRTVLVRESAPDSQRHGDVPQPEDAAVDAVIGGVGEVFGALRRLGYQGSCGELATTSAATTAKLTPWERWYAAWSARIERWWLLLPAATQHTLQSCVGALGLHLWSRADLAYRLSQIAKRPPLRHQGGAKHPAAERGESSRPAAEGGCEWVADAQLSLPSLPQFPADAALHFDLDPFPIPRLLPELVSPEWKRLQGLLDPTLQPTLDPHTPGALGGLGGGAPLHHDMGMRPEPVAASRTVGTFHDGVAFSVGVTVGLSMGAALFCAGLSLSCRGRFDSAVSVFGYRGSCHKEQSRIVT